MNWAYGTHGGSHKFIQNIIEIPERNIFLGRLKYKWEDNTKVYCDI
jgi:hypothetical protein